MNGLISGWNLLLVAGLFSIAVGVPLLLESLSRRLGARSTDPEESRRLPPNA